MLPHTPRHRTRLVAATAAVAAVTAAVAAGIWWTGRPDPVREAGLRLAAAGDFAAAEPHLVAASDNDPRDGEVAGALARGYLAAGDPRAEAVLTRWIKAQPDNAEPLRLRMDYRWKTKNDPQAFDDARKLVRIGCRDMDARRQLIACAIAFGKLEDAENTCVNFLKRMPDDVGVRLLLADVQRSRGNPAAAAHTLTALLKDYPDNAEARAALDHVARN